MDRYAEDEKELQNMKEQLKNRLDNLQKEIQDTRDKLIGVNSRLNYIQYRRQAEAEEPEKDVDEVPDGVEEVDGEMVENIEI